MFYIKTNEAFTAVVALPDSASGNTVTYSIIKISDGSTFASGSMTFVTGYLWKCSFTPTSDDTYVLTVNNTTLDQQKEVVYKSIGSISPSDDDLTTVANFKINFNIKSTFTDHDTMIQNLITQKSKRCSEYCGRKFAARSLTEYYNGELSDTLLLNEYPVNSITSIHDDNDRSYGADTLISSDDYVLINGGLDGIVKLDGAILGDGLNNVKIIYNAGYTTLPGDLVSACEMLIMADYIEHLAGVNATSSDEVIYKPEKLRKEAYAILDRYVRHVRN